MVILLMLWLERLSCLQLSSLSVALFVDFLLAFLDERKVKTSSTNFTQEDTYILSLVPESFANRRAVPTNEFSAKLKDSWKI